MRTLALTLLVFAVPALAQDTTTPAEPEKPAAPEKTETPTAEKPFGGNRVILRGGANIDLNQSINLGGTNTSGARVTAGLNGGIGYLVLPNLSADFDVSLRAYLTPTPEIASLEVTPGARYYVNRLQLRVGIPIPLIPRFGLGVLGGLAWSQPLASRVNFVVGVDYTYYLTESFRQTAPFGRVDLHAGVQTSF